MPNWCLTNYAIEGSKKSIAEIKKAIVKHDNSIFYAWETDVLESLDIKWDKTDHLRGHVIEEPDMNEDGSVLRLVCEEAWEVSDFSRKLKEKYDDITIYWVGEEPMEIYYVTNDKEGKYYPFRYCVDTCIKGTYESNYMNTLDEVYDWLSSITGGEISSATDVQNFEDSCDEDDFIHINKFEVVED